MKELGKNLAAEFMNEEYAHSYMDSFFNMYLAAQIKRLREQRGWSQEDLANNAGMKQERISVLEDVDYDAWTAKTLRKLARAFDVSLKISFESFDNAILDVMNLKSEKLELDSREKALQNFNELALKVGRDGDWKTVDTSYIAPVANFSKQTTLLVEDLAAQTNEWQDLSIQTVAHG